MKTLCFISSKNHSHLDSKTLLHQCHCKKKKERRKELHFKQTQNVNTVVYRRLKRKYKIGYSQIVEVMVIPSSLEIPNQMVDRNPI